MDFESACSARRAITAAFSSRSRSFAAACTFILQHLKMQIKMMESLEKLTALLDLSADSQCPIEKTPSTSAASTRISDRAGGELPNQAAATAATYSPLPSTVSALTSSATPRQRYLRATDQEPGAQATWESGTWRNWGGGGGADGSGLELACWGGGGGVAGRGGS